ncbi:MAG: hypothetical protein ACPGYT_04190 [Nitrospirales bacterium]
MQNYLMNQWGRCVIAGFAAIVLTAGPSSGAILDLTTGSPGVGLGNSFMVSDGGISATVSGLTSDDVAPTFIAGEINVDAGEGGVGICNTSEILLGCSELSDAVGNAGFIREFVLIDFNQSVFLNEAVITNQSSLSVPGTDTDVSFFVGTGVTPDFLTLTPGNLGMIFNDPFNAPTLPSGGTQRTVNLKSYVATPVDWVLLGADLTDQNPEDFFRVTSVEMAPVPIPNSMLLFGTGLGMLLLYNVRRKYSSMT